jgi:hypothetical protein
MFGEDEPGLGANVYQTRRQSKVKAVINDSLAVGMIFIAFLDPNAAEKSVTSRSPFALQEVTYFIN